MIDLAPFKAISFDCYGTLIDWERGILAGLKPVLGEVVRSDPDRVLEAYGRHESAAERGPYRSYREVLEDVAVRLASEFGVDLAPGDRGVIAESIAHWPVFDDTVAALQRLARTHRLVILSNVDDDLFEGTRAKLGVDFDAVVTAEQVGSYKPHRAHFDEGLRRLGLQRESLLHAAQSLYHDIAPARLLGLTTVWVNRRAGRRPGEGDSGGATPASDASPHLEVPDLATLADRLDVSRSAHATNP